MKTNKNRKIWSNVFIFVSVFSLVLFIFRSILFNISTNLFDWNDYPLYVWIIYQNISHVVNFSFVDFFNGNIFYPSQGTLLLSDLFLPHSIFGLFFSRFIKNPITVFNIVFFISWALNIVSAQFFWNKITQKSSLLFFAVLSTTISTFTFMSTAHFQMINFWPFLFALGILIDEKLTNRKAVLLAFWVAIQFYSGVYFGFMLLFTILVWYVLQIKVMMSKQMLSKSVAHLCLLFALLLLLTGPLMYQYYLVKQSFNAVRDYGEYVQYSMHLTDYLFPPHVSSLLYDLFAMKKWATFGRSSGYFPTFAILITSLIGFWGYKKNGKSFSIIHLINRKNIFFSILLFIGIAFSFGPRLSVNGYYTAIPLPYHILLKLVPGFDIMRVTLRWTWLFFIGITYFSTMGLEKLSGKFKYSVFFVSILFIAEVFPLARPTTFQDYYSYENKYLESLCLEDVVLLEYPMTQDKDGVDIVTNLTYRTQMMMATIHHNCTLVNGYSGWIPHDYTNFENLLFSYVEKNEEKKFFDLINQRGADIFKLNKNELFTEKAERIEKWIIDSNFKIHFSDNNYLIISLDEIYEKK